MGLPGATLMRAFVDENARSRYVVVR